MNTASIISKIDDTIRFLLYVLVCFLPYSKAVVETTVVASSLLWIVKHSLLFYRLRSQPSRCDNILIDLGRGFCPAENRLNPGIAFFLLACAVSIAGSALPFQSVHGFFTKTIEWFAVYLLVIEIFVIRRHIEIVLSLFGLTAFVTGLDALFQSLGPHKDVFFHQSLTEGYRVTAAFGHPNILGAFLTIAIPTVLGLFLAEAKNKKKIFLGIIIVVLTWSLFLTFSRGAWMGTSAGILFFVIGAFFPRARPLLRCSLITVAIVVTIFSVDYSFVLKKQHNLVKNDAATVQFRLSLWREGLFLIKERPFFGHGINTFMPVMKNALITSTSPLANGYSPSYAHNCYLQIAVEAGIFGLSAFAGILFLLFSQGLSLISREFEREPHVRFTAIGILSGLLGFLVHSSVDINFYSLQLPVIFWFMAGLLISLDKQLRNTPTYVIK